MPLPLPATAEAATLVADRAQQIQHRYGVPFLLENPAHYLSGLPADPDIGDEFGLMNRITALSGCGQLLDLHNLYCNAVNFGFDASRTLQRIALDRVTEIHVAGGSWSDGFYMDGHDGRVPEPVWDLLEQTLSLAPRVAGVVFELLEMFLPRFGPDRIARELERARGIWRRCHRATEAGGMTPPLTQFQTDLALAGRDGTACAIDPESSGPRFTITMVRAILVRRPQHRGRFGPVLALLPPRERHRRSPSMSIAAAASRRSCRPKARPFCPSWPSACPVIHRMP